MIKIKKSLKKGFAISKKEYFQILSMYIPLILLLCILVAMNSYFPINKYMETFYTLLFFIIYTLFRYGINGVHFSLLYMIKVREKYKKNLLIGKCYLNLLNVFHKRLWWRVLLVGIYKYLLIALWSLIPLFVGSAILATNTLYILYPILLILFIPAFIKAYYTYGFGQCFVFMNKKVSCGSNLHLNHIFMSGNKFKYLLLQLILFVPRLLVSLLVMLIVNLYLHYLILSVGIGVLCYIIITLILLPYIELPKLEFFDNIVKQD